MFSRPVRAILTAQPVFASLAGPVPAPRPIRWAWPGPRGGSSVDVSVGHVSGFRPPEPSLRCRSCGISRSPRAFAHQGLTFRPLFHPSGSSHRSGSRHHPKPPRFETTADRPLPARRGDRSMGRGKKGGDKIPSFSLQGEGARRADEGSYRPLSAASCARTDRLPKHAKMMSSTCVSVSTTDRTLTTAMRAASSTG